MIPNELLQKQRHRNGHASGAAARHQGVGTRPRPLRRTNNRGFPHNVVFDEDAIPSGVSAESLSHEDYVNGPGDQVSTKFDVAGEYRCGRARSPISPLTKAPALPSHKTPCVCSYYCEPHQGAGMVGKVSGASVVWGSFRAPNPLSASE